jgi:hypothetical protein
MDQTTFRTVVLTFVACLVAVTLGFAGQQKLNESQSKLRAGEPKNNVSEAASDEVKVTNGVDSDGKPIHSEWTGKLMQRISLVPEREDPVLFSTA